MLFEERIAEISAFLQFAVTQWPGKRQSVAHEISKRCSKCIVSERFSPLVEGVCQFCRELKPETKAKKEHSRDAEARLAEILERTAGTGAGNYDAVVLFSGGKDSAYLLYRLRQEFTKLRLAALTVDNGFMSQVALDNCRKIHSKLEDIDHFILRPKSGLYAKAFRHALTHLQGSDCYSKVDRMDGDLTFDIGRNFAAMHRAPLLISGLSPEQVERILGFSDFESPKDLESRVRTHSADFELSTLFDARERDNYWWNPNRWEKNQLPRVLHPFHAWNYDEDFIPKEVIRLGLVEAGQDNPLATNNDTIPVMLAVDTQNLGYSSFEPEFANLVRQGKADRATWLAIFEAIEYLASRGEFLPKCVNDTLTRLGLKPKDVGLDTYTVA